MNHTESKGYFGELLAALLLICKGYRILARRFKTPYGEIDIIAKKKNVVVFVEVKARKTMDKCFIAITRKQLQRIQNASEIFMSMKHQFANCDRRYDVILVANSSFPMHIENVTN